MLYEDGLDYENCHHSFSSNPERFYEDILTPGSIAQTTEENSSPCWKKMQLGIGGLPTPPSTPEKNSQRHRNSSSAKMLEPSIMNLTTLHMNNYSSFNQHMSQHSPNNNLQVVPDTITGDDVQDIIPFLTDLGNRSMASPNFFSDASCIQQPHPVTVQQKLSSPSPPCKPIDSLNHSPISYPTENITICGFNDTEQQAFQGNATLYNDAKEGNYPVASYRDHHVTDSRCTTIPTPMSNMHETAIPDCMLSPVSPTKSLKRPYSAISMQSAPPQRSTVPPSSSVVRKLDFLDDYASQKPIAAMSHNSATIAQNIGTMSPNGVSMSQHNGGTVNGNSSQQLAMHPSEQCMRQMTVGGLESYGVMADGAGSVMADCDTAGESELSRATHNVLERQRRNDLKMRFHMLRDNLPELMNNEKAPKIQILKKAYEFTLELKAQEQRLCADKELERQRKFILLRRLHALRQGFF
eukprot:gene18023-19828_t